MKEQLAIRGLEPQEMYLLEDFLYEAVFRRDDQPPYPRTIIGEPKVRVYIEGWGRPGDVCLVALVDGAYAGAVWTRALCGAAKGYGYLDDETSELVISLYAPYRGRGIGTALMRAMLAKLEGSGCRRVSLSVSRENPACRLYARLGFKVVGENAEDYLMALSFAGGA